MTPTPQRFVIDTALISPDRRVSYWEDQCRDSLFSFRCSTHADEGLQAQQTGLDVNPLRIAQTCANEHVIERTPDMVRAHPRESIFVNVILAGEAFVYQRGHCAKLLPGEVLVYDARYPYLFGGARAFTLLHIDIPAPVFQASVARADLSKPIQIGSTQGAHRLYNRTLKHLLLDLLAGPSDPQDVGQAADTRPHQVCDLVGALLGLADGGVLMSGLSAGHLLAAKAYIDAHFGDEDLCAEQVARAVGVSERHLRRLFAAQDTSVADFLMTRRLSHAYQALQDPQQRTGTVAEMAWHCGFASHAHFSRSFKQRFGVTPSELVRTAHH